MSPQSTADRLRAYLVKHPSATAADAGRALGVTRQRIHRIAQDEGLELTKYRSEPAPAGGLGTSIAPPPFTGRATTTADRAESVARLRVAADLAARGYEVYLPDGPDVAFDIVAHDPGTGRFEGFTVLTSKPKAVRYDDLADGSRQAIAIGNADIAYRPVFRD